MRGAVRRPINRFGLWLRHRALGALLTRGISPVGSRGPITGDHRILYRGIAGEELFNLASSGIPAVEKIGACVNWLTWSGLAFDY